MRGCGRGQHYLVGSGFEGTKKRDFWKAKKPSTLNAPVGAFMAQNVFTIEPGTRPMQAARLMIEHDIGRLPVMENGSGIGILTISDTMRCLYDLQPE
jgi:predicted transcriptional regulator